MKLSDIVSTLNSLVDWRATVTAAKSVSAEVFAAFSTKLDTLSATVSGQLTQLTTDLATANASVSSLTTEKTDLSTKLDASNLQLKSIDAAIKAAAQNLGLTLEAGKSHVENITLIATAVSGTISKLQVDAGTVPLPAKTSAQGQSDNGKKLSLDEQVAAAKANQTKPTK